MMPELNVLDPDDNLMKKFQKALHDHLLHVDNRLSEDILNLEASVEEVEKNLESEGVYLYQTQEQVSRQHVTLQQYMEALSKIALSREKINNDIENAKEIQKKNCLKLKEANDRRERVSEELNNLSAFYNCLSKWEKDLNDHLIISKQMSLQDANRNRILINKKQQRDFILYRLKEQIWKIESEIAYLDRQLQIKENEKENANRMIIDANTDLETLHIEHKDLHHAWKSVVNNISKRDNIYDRLHLEQMGTHKLYDGLLLDVQKVRKETEKEMEVNEHLTSLTFRIENNVKITSRAIKAYNEKMINKESELLNLTKISEQTHRDYNAIFVEYQNYLQEGEQVTRKLEIILEKKNNLEDMIFKRLEEKILCDKTAHRVNELLINTKNVLKEHEISVACMENTYGNNRLELEKLENLIENQETELQELSRKSAKKERQIDELEKEINRYEMLIEKTQVKLQGINKLIEQILQNIDGEELSPQDLKITSLERNILKLLKNIKKTQQFWIRRQGLVVSLSQQRESQLREITLLEKEVMIMGQKNFKLEYALEILVKEDANTNKIIASLDQKLSRISANLAIQKDLKKELEDQSCIIKNDYLLSLRELESELVKLHSDIKNICTEKLVLNGELKSAQQESLSWEKQIQLMQDTIKNIKEEQTAGGSIASMKSEIHKMKMRFYYLKKIQEKLIHDMDLCIARRDIIVDKAFGKNKKNEKVKHNEKIITRKRLSDQRSKIKQLLKITKQTANTTETLKDETTCLQKKVIKCQEILENLKERIRSTEDEIKQVELLSYHNLHSLVLKQRKVKQLNNIKNGMYKMIYKNENAIEENLQKEYRCRENLKCTLEKTDHDFPMLKDDIKKILLTLQIF